MSRADGSVELAELAGRLTADPSPLAGTWALTRSVREHGTGERGSARGSVRVRPHGQGLFGWHESGKLTWAGQPVRPFTRDLALRRRQDQWWMTFADGAPFHPWLLGEPVEHLCGEDVYRGVVSVTAQRGGSASELHIRWEVTGPAKNQRLESTLRRPG